MERPQTEREATRNLQTYLRQLSYHDPGITPPPIDGIFGNATRQALCEFQRQSGLPVTGIATLDTWNALYEAYRVSLAENAMPSRVAVFPATPKNYCLSLGCRHFSVAVLQYMLRELQHDVGDEIPIEISGTFDDATEQAVKEFQRCCDGLDCNGTVDCKTWDAIVLRYNALVERPPKE